MNLDRLRAQIRLHFPEYAILSNILDWDTDTSIPTACTNGKWVKFNPDFMSDLTTKQQLFVALHEIEHIIRKHPFRRGDRDPALFNEAGDYAINMYLSQDKSGHIEMPNCGLLNSDYADLTEYEIYELLQKQQEDGNHQPKQGMGDFEDCPEDGDQDSESGDSDNDEPESKPAGSRTAEEQESVIDQAIQTCDQISRLAGTGSGRFGKLAEELRKPIIKWEQVLRRFMSAMFPKFRSHRRPDQRALAAGIYYPGIEKESTSELIFAVDCSYSMPRSTVAQCFAEVKSAFETCNLTRVHVVYFTHGIDKVETFEQGQTFELPEWVPGGGTDFDSVFEFCDTLPNAKAVIVLTDGYASFPKGYSRPVLWGMTTNAQPPFGERMQL